MPNVLQGTVVLVLSGLACFAAVASAAAGSNAVTTDRSDTFSFAVDGALSRDAPATWKRDTRTLSPDAADPWEPRYAAARADLDRAEWVTYTGASSTVTAQREVFHDHDAYVQVVTFTNASSTDSPVFGDVLPLDTTFSFDADGPIALHYAKGSHNEPTDFQPMEIALGPGKPVTFAPYGGRSSDGSLPYFNLAAPNGGVIVAIGWTGQWKATFEAVDARRVRVTAGMERTHIRLREGESLRTPAVLVLRWKGNDWIDGQNALRRLMLRHFTPQRNGAPVVPPIAASPHAYIGFNDITETNLRDGIDRIAAHTLPVDMFWLDAGWGAGGFPRGMGNPDPDPARFPNGLKPVGAAAHARGFKYLQWFEPERVMPGTWIERNYPDWLLSPTGLPPELAYHDTDGFRLLDLGNDAARAWLTKKISAQIAEYEIDVYRQDFNMCPLYYWRNGEPADRAGMREARYIDGLYEFLDALRADHPHLVIDNCASGGRRLDFEMMRRSLALWRSDHCWEPMGEQGMTYGLSLWLPVHGVGSVSLAPYDFRSGMGSSFSLALDYRSDEPTFWDQARVRLDELAKVREFFSKDFYPLTPYSVSDDTWIAWQYHDPGKNAGIVQAFRRPNAADPALTVKLRGLHAANGYCVHNVDSSGEQILSGAHLAQNGLPIAIATTPGSALLTYSSIPR
ncbi:MAG: alpha-galactosidase [Candidatus Hydrogenedentes bacterium]|nr:alpha-galactosidase [Candidatus Hydrogenedentota bacterium]